MPETPSLSRRRSRAYPLALLLAASCAGRLDPSRPAAGVIAPAPVTRSVAADPRGEAVRLFYAAAAGDKGAADESRRRWLAIGEKGSDPVARAYLGASTMLAGGYATWPWEKGRLAREGMTLLDEAVAAAPDDLEVRFLRGMTCYRLPRFFGRYDGAAADLAWVAARAGRAAGEGAFPPALAAAALYHHGLIREEAGDHAAATAAWREAAAVGPETPSGRAAAARLGAGAQSSGR